MSEHEESKEDVPSTLPDDDEQNHNLPEPEVQEEILEKKVKN